MTDLEAVTRLIELVHRELHHRRAQRRSSPQPQPTGSQPMVLVVIDDYGNLAATFEGAGTSAALYPWFEKLNRVITDGRGHGVHTALSATRRAVVKAGVLASITNRIVLRQADPASFVEHGLPGSLHDAELVPGRGFLTATIQVQIATSDPAAHTVARTAARCAPSHGQEPVPSGAKRRPGALTTEALATAVHLDSLSSTSRARHSVVIGVADLAPRGDVVTIDLTRSDLAVVGGPGAGRSTVLATIAQQLATAGVEVWAIGAVDSPVAAVVELHRRAFGSIDDIVANLDELGEWATSEPASGHAPTLVIDDLDLLDQQALERPLARVAAAGIRWLAATTSATTYSMNPFVQQLRRTRPLLYLQPESGRNVHELTGVAATIRPGLPMPPGRGMFITDRRATVVQVAKI